MQEIPESVQAIIAKIDEGRFYSPKEWAELRGVKPAAVHRAIWRGQGPQFIKIGGTRRAAGRALIEYLVASVTSPPAKRDRPRINGAFAKTEARA